MTSAIQVDGLTFIYKGRKEKALDEITFKQEQGETVVLMGRSGAGKSTFSRCLTRLVPLFYPGELKGSVRIFGEFIHNKRIQDLTRLIGIVFQDFETQLFSTNVGLEVAFGPENLRVPRNEIKERVVESLRLVRLGGFEGREPAGLSGGEKQRLAIASILAIKPKILILDEPTTDLDPQGKKEIFSLANKLKEEGLTVLLIEHETEPIQDVDRIIIMEKGKIIREDKPKEVLQDVNFLESHGIRPPQIPKLFKEMKSSVIPFSVSEALEVMERYGWKISEDRYESLLGNDREKERTSGESLIEIADLDYVYPPGIKALDGINLNINAGDFLVIVGQNGSGKTTLAKHLNGLLKPTRGKVWIKGQDTTRKAVSELARIVGYVFQNPDHQIFADTVEEEVAFAPKNLGIAADRIPLLVQEALTNVGLEGYDKSDPFFLSKGEKQRVAIASVLSTKPEILILDEPTTGLDYKEQKSIMELLCMLNRKGHTILVITHSLWIAAEYAKRVIVLNKGRIVLDGTPREVFSRETILCDMFLNPPQIVSLSNRMGKVLLSVEEMKYCLGKETY